MKYIDRFTDDKTGLRWYLFDDTIRIGVTSVTGVIVAPKLKQWFKKTDAADIAKKSNDSASFGTGMHDVLEKYILKQPVEVDEKQSECLESFKSWLSGHDLEVIETEPILYHGHYLYAGQGDLVCMFDGKRELWDYKTGRFSSGGAQFGAYKLAWEDMHPDLPIEGIRVIKIGKEVKDFEFKHIDYICDNWLHNFQSFKGIMFNELIKGVEYKGNRYSWTLEQTRMDCFKDYYQNLDIDELI